MSKELKPCPFCGEAVVISCNFSCCYFIECDSCFIRTDVDSLPEIIKKWNNRKPLSVLAVKKETPRERFRREYRDARMVSALAPALNEATLEDFTQDWVDAVTRQCSPTAAYAVLSFDSMENNPVESRLDRFIYQKKWCQAKERSWN